MEDTKLLALTQKLLDEKKYVTLRKILEEEEPVDIGELFEELSPSQILLIFRLLPKEPAAEVFVYLDGEVQEQLIRSFSDSELKEVLDELYMDDAVDMIEEMPANVVKRILRQASPEMRASINNLLKYPKDSAGSIMTTEYVDFKKDMTVRDAIRRIRRTGVDKETIYTCYVTDNDRVLQGTVSAKDLLVNESDTLIEDIMETSVISVRTLDDKEEVANQLSRYDFIAMPVVDGSSRLVGIVTVDDAIDVITEEATEDIERMAAISPSDKTYIRTGVFETWKKRIPWLLILLVSATFTGIIISANSAMITGAVFLVAFIPVLMDTAGNTGSQAAVSVIRSLSLDEIDFKDTFTVLWKEVRVGALCGATLAAANFAKIMIFDRLICGDENITVIVALAISLSIFISVVFAKMIGCTLPILSKKLGFDPAIMSSPFVTTLVDTVSLLIYFIVARVLL